MLINVTITTEDYKSYLKAIKNYLRSGDYKRAETSKSLLTKLLSGIVIGVFAALVVRRFDIRLDVFSLASGVILFASIALIMAKRYQDKALPRHDGVLIGQHEFIFEEAQFTDKTALYTTTMNWEAVISVQETDKHFFLLLDSCVGYIIPKRELVAEEAAQQLRQIFSQNVKQ